jgi:hypothetical protein
VSILYFGQFNPFHFSLLSFAFFTPLLFIIQQLSIYILTASACTDVIYFDIIDYHALFLSLLPQVP